MSPVGKPPRAGEAATCRLVVLLTEHERALVEKAAKKRGASMGEVVRDALVKTGVLK